MPGAVEMGMGAGPPCMPNRGALWCDGGACRLAMEPPTRCSMNSCHEPEKGCDTWGPADPSCDMPAGETRPLAPGAGRVGVPLPLARPVPGAAPLACRARSVMVSRSWLSTFSVVVALLLSKLWVDRAKHVANVSTGREMCFKLGVSMVCHQTQTL